MVTLDLNVQDSHVSVQSHRALTYAVEMEHVSMQMHAFAKLDMLDSNVMHVKLDSHSLVANVLDLGLEQKVTNLLLC